MKPFERFRGETFGNVKIRDTVGFGCTDPEVLIALGVLVCLLYYYNNIATRNNYIRE